MLNPYAAYLKGQNALDVIAATPARLAEAMKADYATPPAGKWDAREVLCHLADTEITFAFRLRQAASEEHHTIQPFDQDRWAAVYGAYDAATALKTFQMVRDWNLRFLRAQPQSIYSKPVSHPERGAMTFQTVVETMAGHDLNHIRQLEALQRKTA